MFQQQLARFRQADFTSLTVEQTRLIGSLQFLYMLGDGRLTDKQFLRSFCKAQILRY